MFLLFLIILTFILAIYSAKRRTSIALDRAKLEDWKPSQDALDKIKELEAQITQYEKEGSYHYERAIERARKEIKELKTAPEPKNDWFNMPIVWNSALAVNAILCLIFVLQTSLVTVDKDTTAHFERKWGGETLEAGQNISRKKMSIFGGGKGLQAETVRTAGTHFMFLQNVLYKRADDDMEKMLIVPPGMFAVLVAQDGKPMTGGRMLAPEWPADKFTPMLEDALYFLNEGNGTKGMQYTVVPSGKYHINNYLWKLVDFYPEVKVGTGEVAVIRSNIQLDPTAECKAEDSTTAVPLVPKGCRGVWIDEEGQGTYRFNPRAVTPTPISVRQNQNDHRGGFTRQLISFTTDREGNVVPKLTPEKVPQGDAIDDAIDIRAEGWNIDQGLTVFWQVIDAPKAVAQLGDQDKIAEFISRVTQSTFPIVAQGTDLSTCIVPQELDKKQKADKALVAANKKVAEEYEACASTARKAFDLIYKREEIEDQTLVAIQKEVESYGIKIPKVTMGRPNIPTELLMPSLRIQYAEKMRVTLTEEELTAQKRIAVANANELANNQQILVKEDLLDQAAAKQASRIVKLSVARKTAAENEAEGQSKLLNVMGPENVQEQILAQKILDLMEKCPECVKVSDVSVVSYGANGNGGSLEGMAAILGNSNLKAALVNAKGNK